MPPVAVVFPTERMWAGCNVCSPSPSSLVAVSPAPAFWRLLIAPAVTPVRLTGLPALLPGWVWNGDVDSKGQILNQQLEHGYKMTR